MKKLTSLLLSLCFACALAAPALAANDVVWSQDTTLTSFINRYDNATVKAGVTLTMKAFQPDPQGLEIASSLTVEAGGRITGGGCIIFARGATCSGLALYYRVAGVEKPLAVTLAEVVASDPNADYRPTFLYDSATGHYVLVADFSNDPFEQPAAGGDGTEVLAEGLKSLGLFLGGGNGFELNRAPTRTEEVVMLLRLLGNQDADLKAYPAENCPFDDVDGWARSYIAFAYDQGLTNGVGGGRFNTAAAPTAEQLAQMFCTFVLRAMGYRDGSDFTYDGAIAFADQNGLLRGGASGGDVTGFDRGACVRIMESALRQSTKDGTALWQKLAADGVFTEEAYRAAMPQ